MSADGAASLAERAYLAIRDKIVALELRPGAVVSEKALTEELGIGRTPVREALRRLAQEQLIEVFPRRGMFVTTLESRDLASIHEVRALLEPLAAQHAAERRSEDEFHALLALDDELSRTTERTTQRELMALDERVHRLVYRCAHNEYLAQTLEEYYVHALRIWHVALDQANTLGSSVHAHRRLLNTIAKGDAPEAARLMRKHVDDFEKAISRVLIDV